MSKGLDAEGLRSALSLLVEHPKEQAAVMALVRQHDRLVSSLKCVESTVRSALLRIEELPAKLERGNRRGAWSG